MTKKKKQQVNKDEYTRHENIDNAPEMCNEFAVEYLDNNDYFGITADDDKNELIEMIQHFCFWIFKKGYTQCRLTLLQD